MKRKPKDYYFYRGEVILRNTGPGNRMRYSANRVGSANTLAEMKQLIRQSKNL